MDKITLEEINNVDDKVERLRLLTEYVQRILRDQRTEDELVADEQMNASRDEAFGMMGRFGKPGGE